MLCLWPISCSLSHGDGVAKPKSSSELTTSGFSSSLPINAFPAFKTLAALLSLMAAAQTFLAKTLAKNAYTNFGDMFPLWGSLSGNHALDSMQPKLAAA